MAATEDTLDIPAFLRFTREERRAGWERWLASRGGKFTDPWRDGAGAAKRDWRRPQSLTDEEWAYWCDVEARKAAAKREADEPRFEAMRAKAKEDREARASVRAAVRASIDATLAKQPQPDKGTTTKRRRKKAATKVPPTKPKRRAPQRKSKR